MKTQIFSELKYIKPFAVQIWCGESKPDPLNDYLEQFVSELNDLMENGMQINGKHITVLFRCFICDSPARSFVKGEFEFLEFVVEFIHHSFDCV